MIYERRSGEKVTVVPGTPCTFRVGSDTYGGYVTKVSPSGHKVWFRWGDPAVHGTTEFEEDDRCATRRSTKTERPIYRERGSKHGFVWFGEAIDYRDPSF